MSIRCFAAILLADTVRDAVAREVDRLRPLSRAVAWVPGENLHITMRFLGEQPDARVTDAVEALHEAAEGSVPFDLALGGLGGFPSLDRPRVLWVGAVAGAADARRLQHQVADALDRRRFGREERDWHPHVTVGRVFDEPRWRREGAPAVRAAIQAAPAPVFGSFTVSAISLVRSQLGRGGARYTPLATVALSGSPGGLPAPGTG